MLSKSEKFILPSVNEDVEEESMSDMKATSEQHCLENECRAKKEKLEACNVRVGENPGTEETCVEEFFKVMHCVNHCAPPKYFSKLK